MQKGMIKGFGKSAGMLAAIGLMAAPGIHAGVLLSENFESAAGLADGNWANPGSAQIVVDPLNAANKVVRFNSFGIGGDLFSVFLPYATDPGYDGRLFFSFDVLHFPGTLHAYAGTDHQTSPFGAEQWLWSDDGASPHSTPLTPGVWTHVSFVFSPYDPGSVGTIVAKFEANPGTDFFDNITLATAPEPSTWAIALGWLGLLVALYRRRRAEKEIDDEIE